MTWIVADRVKETTTTTGTGDVTLAGAVSQYRAFSDVCANGDEVPYVIVGQAGTEWEAGIGRWNTGGTLTRVRVRASSNAGALVNFSAGTKDVFIDAVADMISALPVKRLQDGDRYLPPGTSLYVTDDYEIAANKELEIGGDALLEIG